MEVAICCSQAAISPSVECETVASRFVLELGLAQSPA
jgi:hypothetical protein